MASYRTEIVRLRAALKRIAEDANELSRTEDVSAPDQRAYKALADIAAAALNPK